MSQDITLFDTIDEAEGQLDSAISAGVLTIVLKSGQGALFPSTKNGNATSDGSSTVLNSTGIGASGIQVGDFIQNLTDGSHAFVLNVDTNNITTTSLRNGSDNIWQNSDEYLVGQFVITLNIRDAEGAITTSEKALVKTRTGDTLYIATGGRGYDGTTPSPFSADDYCNLFVESSLQDQIKKAFAEAFEDIDDRYTKAQVDALLKLRNWKDDVIAATVSAGTLASDFENGDSVDNVTLSTGDRILIKNQADNRENGIYIVNASGAPTRADDFDETAEITAAVVPVQQGDTNGNTIWICTSNDPTVGVDPILFSQIGGAVAQSNILEENVTTGETVNGATTPKVVFIDDGDVGIAGRYYQSDANNIDRLKVDGFVTNNKVAGETDDVIIEGVLGGFSSLIPGRYLFVDDVAGNISLSPGAYTLPAAKAMSTTRVRICKNLVEGADFLKLIQPPVTFANWFDADNGGGSITQQAYEVSLTTGGVSGRYKYERTALYHSFNRVVTFANLNTGDIIIIEGVFSVSSIAAMSSFFGISSQTDVYNKPAAGAAAAAFWIENGVLSSITTDEGTGLTENTIGGITLTNRNQYRIVYRVGEECKFYVNEQLKFTHTTNLPVTATSSPQIILGIGIETAEAVAKTIAIIRTNFSLQLLQ